MQVLGFHQCDRFFVNRAYVGQRMSALQPGEEHFVITNLAAFASVVPENRPAGVPGADDGLQKTSVDSGKLFETFFRHTPADNVFRSVCRQFGIGVYDVQDRQVFVEEDEHVGIGVEHRVIQGGNRGEMVVSHGFGYYFLGVTGIFTVNRDPFPGREETAIRPPIPSMMVLQTDRPSPAPCLNESI